MQVCIIYGGNSKGNSKLKEISEAIAKGVEKQGISNVSIYNMMTDNDKRLTIYDYLVVVSEPISFLSGKVPSYISKFLENAGTVSGKRAACVITGGLRGQKALLNLMKITEGQGIILKTSDIIKKEDEAISFGAHLNVERNF